MNLCEYLNLYISATMNLSSLRNGMVSVLNQCHHHPYPWKNFFLHFWCTGRVTFGSIQNWEGEQQPRSNPNIKDF